MKYWNHRERVGIESGKLKKRQMFETERKKAPDLKNEDSQNAEERV